MECDIECDRYFEIALYVIDNNGNGYRADSRPLLRSDRAYAICVIA